MPASKQLPTAVLLAVAIPLTLTLCTWAIAVHRLSTPKRTVLLLGDSYVANFRLLPGDRLEDALNRDLGRDWTVRNWAQIGADPADQYLKLCEAELLRVRPDVVVLPLSPHSFIPDTTNPGHRFREDRDDLRWLPLNAEGLRFFRTLTHEERDAAIVRKAELLFGFYDGYLALDEHPDYPALRRQMARRSPELQRAIVRDYSSKISAWLDANVHLTDYASYAERPGARDFVFFAEALARRKIPLVVAVLQAADPSIYDEVFSAQTRRTLDLSYAYTLRILEEHHVPYLDYNTRAERAYFRPSDYGDHYHLKSPAAYRHLADGIAAWIEKHAERRGT